MNNIEEELDFVDDIPVFKVKPEGDFWYLNGERGCHLVFTCPKCKKKNYHGGSFGKKGDGDGHRMSHCECWPNGYYLKEI